MKAIIQFTLTLVLFCSSLLMTAQEVEIVAPAEICEGDCYTIFITTQGIDSSTVVQFTDGFFVIQENILDFNQSQHFIDFCLTGGALAVTIAVIDGSGEELASAIMIVNPIEFIDIRSSAASFCPEGQNTGCEDVCEFAQVVYTIPNNYGPDVVWNVTGAESYEWDENQCIVQWGEAGIGTVYVESFGSTTSAPDMVATMDPQLDPNGILNIFMGVSGGTAPYTTTWPVELPLGSGAIDNLPSGTYTVIITDAAGISIEEYIHVFNQGQSFMAVVVNSSLPSDCNSSDGSLGVLVAGTIPPYTFAWSNGSTAAIISDLAPGDYCMEVADNEGNLLTFCESLGCSSGVISPCLAFGDLCVNILENPTAAFETVPASNNGTLTVCEGQEVQFLNQSLAADRYVWDFGNSQSSTEVNTSYTYETPGTYEVLLISRNSCFCADSTFLTVEVEQAYVPEIECVGAICEYDTVTYSSAAPCTQFQWNIVGDGTILDGGGAADNFISVAWGQGPEGFVELLVGGCPGTTCVLTTSERIPIISDLAEIEGPQQVCRGALSSYSVDAFGGVEYTWTTSFLGRIVQGQNSADIVVEWGNSFNDNQWVAVEYFNCYLECGGRDTINVAVRPEVYVEGDIQGCQNSEVTYTARRELWNTPVEANWSLIDAQNSTVVWSSAAPAETVTIDLAYAPGRYIVEAQATVPTDFCEPVAELLMKIEDLPAPPTGMVGEVEICPGISYAYDAQSPSPSFGFTWYVQDGTNEYTLDGKVVNITWGPNPPYVLSVSQTDDAGLNCESDTISMTLQQLPDYTLTGPDEVCQGDVVIYDATAFNNVPYSWTILPANAGTILSGAGSPQIEVQWNQVGNASVTLDLCSNQKTIAVSTFALPDPIVNHTAKICPGETAPVSTATLYSGYLWKNESGAVISTDPNPDLMPGVYEVEVVDSRGCEGVTQFTIESFPAPSVNVTIPGPNAFCPTAGEGPVTLSALASQGGYTYEWLYNGSPIANASSSLVTFDAGSYQVRITDQNGCTALSNSVQVFHDCSGGGPCNGNCPAVPDCGPDEHLNIVMTNGADCNEIVFTTDPLVFAQVDPDPTWVFVDWLTNNFMFNYEQHPTMNFSTAGYYPVFLYGEVRDPNNPGGPLIFCWDFEVAEVDATADFKAEEVCIGEPTLFFDNAVFTPTSGITSYAWDFGDPASGANNTSTDPNPQHIYVTAGTYPVTLTITANDGCEHTIVKNVEAVAPPSGMIIPPSEYCEGTPLLFEYTSTDPTISEIAWDFGDPSTGDANASVKASAYHAFSGPGSYTITLTLTSVYGCETILTENVVVEPNGLNGPIQLSQPSPICQGDIVTLSAPAGGIAWVWSTGEMTETIEVQQAETYGVTVTDVDGCTYTPGSETIDVIPLPSSEIYAVDYNEFEQPVNFTYGQYAACFGDNVFLQAEVNGNFSFLWDNGLNTQEISFTEWRPNLLNIGTHEFTVTVTDNNTGCSSVEGPFEVTIHPLPTNVQIESVPGGDLCENISATFQVINPDPNYTYVWNTGEIGNTISSIYEGEYFVRAINQFGCEAESNHMTINAGPDVSKVPSGCLRRCKPDTICLPIIPDIATYQWFFDGSPVAAPNGTQPDLVAEESGEYMLEMETIYGCISRSDPFYLDLYQGTGDITGEVYFDVNDNGIIDGPDTLMSNIPIILWENGLAIDTLWSDANGAYLFDDILATAYQLQLDTIVLPNGAAALIVDQDSELTGCDQVNRVDWLIIPLCAPESFRIELETCAGDSLSFGNSIIPPGDSITLQLTSAFGCDSTVTIVSVPYPLSTGQQLLSACEGEQVMYEGVMLDAGQDTTLVLTNMLGCDSTVFVQVAELSIDTMQFSYSGCEGSSLTIGSNTIVVTTDEDYVENLTNMNGCDSVVIHSIQVTEVDTSYLALETCSDELINYNNTLLNAGAEVAFTFTDQAGCDSIVIVSVTAFESFAFDLSSTESCENGATGSALISMQPGGLGPFVFSADGVNYQTDDVLENLAPGLTTIYVQDANGCTQEAEIEVPAFPELQILTEDIILECGEAEVQLAATVGGGPGGPVSYLWSTGEAGPTTMATTPGIYGLTVVDACETHERQVEVYMGVDGRSEFLFIPNVFTPNGDGHNDEWKVMWGDDVIVNNFELMVFTRWGDTVFELNDPNGEWNGNLGTRSMQNGVYVYYLTTSIEVCGQTLQLQKEGDVTVMR